MLVWFHGGPLRNPNPLWELARITHRTSAGSVIAGLRTLPKCTFQSGSLSCCSLSPLPSSGFATCVPLVVYVRAAGIPWGLRLVAPSAAIRLHSPGHLTTVLQSDGPPVARRGVIGSQRRLRAATGRRAPEEWSQESPAEGGVDRQHHTRDHEGWRLPSNTGPAMRRVVLILVLLLAGAVVNVAVAWTSAVFVDVAEGQGEILEHSQDGELVRRYWTSTGERLVLGQPWLASDLTPQVESFLPSWGARFLLRRGSYNELDHGVAEGRGWPLRALWGGVRYSLAERALLTSGAIPLHEFDGPPFRFRFLPHYPIWPGFVANTAFYAAILWLLIPGPFALRRLIRPRRGLCPKCGYDLQHAEHESCPECGKHLPGHATTLVVVLLLCSCATPVAVDDRMPPEQDGRKAALADIWVSVHNLDRTDVIDARWTDEGIFVDVPLPPGRRAPQVGSTWGSFRRGVPPLTLGITEIHSDYFTGIVVLPEQ